MDKNIEISVIAPVLDEKEIVIENSAKLREVETIQQALTTHYSNKCDCATTIATNDDPKPSRRTKKLLQVRNSSMLTADVATEMFRESGSRRKSKNHC